MFNNYFPNNNPYVSTYQNPMGNIPNQYHTQSQSLIRVTGIDGARAYQMPPNSVVPLFDSDNDIMYIKSTDGAGFPTIKAFAFTPYEPTQSTPISDYVTRAEFEELKGMIENGKQSVSKSSKKSEDE
jgi:hypothetical protein